MSHEAWRHWSKAKRSMVRSLQLKKPQVEDAAEAETRAMLVDCRARLEGDHFVFISRRPWQRVGRRG
jgi:hypothetical protein